MDKENRGLEWKVGLFLTIGMAVIAALSIYFGKLGKGLESFYRVTVEFENASGLLKGADVLLSGARVGFVDESPALIEGKFAVRVGLKIREGVLIPKKSTIVVATAGFIGDASVSISPLKDASVDDVFKPGEYVKGDKAEGFSELADKGGDVMDELKKTLGSVKDAVAKIETGILSDTNVANLKTTFENLKSTSENFKKASTDVDKLVANGKDAMQSAKDAMDAAKTAAGKLDGALAKADTAFAKVDGAVETIKTSFTSVGKFADTATKTMDSARLLVNKANSGSGALGMLLADKETAENLKTFIRNVKQRGLLFYRDKVKE